MRQPSRKPIGHYPVYFSNWGLLGSMGCRSSNRFVRIKLTKGSLWASCEARVQLQRRFASLPSVVLTEGNEDNEEQGNRIGDPLSIQVPTQCFGLV